MASYEERLPSFFENKWIFKEGSPSPLNMAKAGFICTTRTAVECYYCGKELDGWEESDNPWQEHKRHASCCPYIKKYERCPDEITILDAVQLEKERLLLKIKRKYDAAQKEIDKAFNDLEKAGAGGKKGKR